MTSLYMALPKSGGSGGGAQQSLPRTYATSSGAQSSGTKLLEEEYAYGNEGATEEHFMPGITKIAGASVPQKIQEPTGSGGGAADRSMYLAPPK